MTPEQEEKIKLLEDAFSKCRLSNIVFVGMGNHLVAFDRKTLMDAGYREDSIKAVFSCRADAKSIDTWIAFVSWGVKLDWDAL